jgi:hypothetical protein
MTIVKKEIVEYDRRKSSVQLTCAEKRTPFKLSQQKTTAACGDINKFFIVRLHFYVIVNRESTLQLTTMQRGKQIKRSYVVTRLGEIQHTALGNPLTKQRTRPDHRLTTRDVRSLLHSHTTSLLWKKRPRTPIFVTTSLCTLRIINIRCFILYSTHGTEDVAQMKNVQDETEAVSDFASRTLTYLETSYCMQRDVYPQKNLLNKDFYKTKSETIPLGELRWRSDDWVNTGCVWL